MGLSLCLGEVGPQGKELTEHGTAGLPIACYEDDLAAKAVPWHWHEELECIVVTEGTAILAVGMEKYTVTPGNGLFINAGAPHGCWSKGAGECRLHSVVFHPRLIGGSHGSIYWKKYLNPLLADISRKEVLLQEKVLWQQEAMLHIEQAWQVCVQEPKGYEFQIREELSKLLFLLCTNENLEGRRIPSAKEQRNGERIKFMLQFIQMHLSEEISIEDIARSSNISVSECLRCFRATVGVSPMRYVKQLRLELACELLQETTQKVADIAAQCGYEDESYFSKLFREAKGCTPSVYRQNKSALHFLAE